jgi:hypothetical protein
MRNSNATADYATENISRVDVNALSVFTRGAVESRAFGEFMSSAEGADIDGKRQFLVLDTSAPGNAVGLYAGCGSTRLGTIPGFARDPERPLIDTVFNYKHLARR